jgi:hypothetical protein
VESLTGWRVSGAGVLTTDTGTGVTLGSRSVTNNGATWTTDQGVAAPPWGLPADQPDAVQGQTWTLSADWTTAANGAYRMYLTERNSAGNSLATEHAATFSLNGFARKVITATLTNASTANLAAFYVSTASSQPRAYIDKVQLEQKTHETTFCMGDMGTGYAWVGTAYASASTRTAAKIEISCTLPGSVAFRYRETETGAMSFGYITSLTGNNVGTYGKISHGSGKLTIESDRLLVIGPVFAFGGTLNSDQRALLEAETTWTFGMDLGDVASPAVKVGGTVAQATGYKAKIGGTVVDVTGYKTKVGGSVVDVGSV